MRYERVLFSPAALIGTADGGPASGTLPQDKHARAGDSSQLRDAICNCCSQHHEEQHAWSGYLLHHQVSSVSTPAKYWASRAARARRSQDSSIYPFNDSVTTPLRSHPPRQRRRMLQSQVDRVKRMNEH